MASGKRASIQRPPSYAQDPPNFSTEAEEARASGVSVRMTGLFQTILGCASVILGVVAAFLECYLSYYVVPIWGGVLFFFATGVVGIRTYYKKMSKGMMISYMVMCICSAVLAAIMFVMYINIALEESYSYFCFSYEKCRQLRIRTIIDIIIALLSFCELAVAVTGSSITCCRICRCCVSTPSPVNMVYYNPPAGGRQAFPQYTAAGSVGGQPMLVQGAAHQPVYPPGNQPTDAAQMTGVVVSGSSPTHTKATVASSQEGTSYQKSPEKVPL